MKQGSRSTLKYNFAKFDAVTSFSKWAGICTCKCVHSFSIPPRILDQEDRESQLGNIATLLVQHPAIKTDIYNITSYLKFCRRVAISNKDTYMTFLELGTAIRIECTLLCLEVGSYSWYGVLHLQYFPTVRKFEKFCETPFRNIDRLAEHLELTKRPVNR